MAFDVFVDCNKDEARWALMQFALRRGMRIVEPWYLDGVRVEGPPAPSRGAWENHRNGWWDRAGSVFFNWPTDRPAVDIEFARKKGRTVVSMSPGSREDCLMLAHRIEAFLRDGGARMPTTPAVCPTCQAPVEVVIANYCGRCGKRLSVTAEDMPPKRRKQRAPDRELQIEQSQTWQSVPTSEATAAGEVVIERRDEFEAEPAVDTESNDAVPPIVVADRNDSSGVADVRETPDRAAVPEGEAAKKEHAQQRRFARDAEAEAVVED